MTYKTLIRKGTAQKIKAGSLSSVQMKRLSHAVSDLQRRSIKSLLLTGKVRKLSIPNRSNIYIYRMSPQERIVFSTVKGNNVIHDVINVKSNQSILLTSEK